MKIIEGKYLSYTQRLIHWRMLVCVYVFLLYSYLIFNFSLIKEFAIYIEIINFIICASVYLHKTKKNIHKIGFDKDDNIILEGETYNKIWEDLINLDQSKIFIKGKPSRTGICGVLFKIKLKNTKVNYTINLFNNFTEKEILDFFNEFKHRKKEKIILDEKLILNRIQEKIDKCQ